VGGRIFRRRASAPTPLRYLVYLSDTKIDMLLEQIPEPVRRRVATELKLDLKLISLTVTAGESPLGRESRLAKLDLVERYLEQHHEIGSVSEPSGYFRGRLPMAWAPIGMPDPASGIAFFCGYEQRRLVALGGSPAHLLGVGSADRGLGSHPFAIQAALNSAAGGADPMRLGDDLLAVAQELYQTPQLVEFLARRITMAPLRDLAPGADYLLGTPLYVQVVDA